MHCKITEVFHLTEIYSFWKTQLKTKTQSDLKNDQNFSLCLNFPSLVQYETSFGPDLIRLCLILTQFA